MCPSPNTATLNSAGGHPLTSRLPGELHFAIGDLCQYFPYAFAYHFYMIKQEASKGVGAGDQDFTGEIVNLVNARMGSEQKLDLSNSN